MQQLRDLVIDINVFGFILFVAMLIVATIAALCYGVYALIKKCRRFLYSRRRRPTIEQVADIARLTIPNHSRLRMWDHEEE